MYISVIEHLGLFYTFDIAAALATSGWLSLREGTCPRARARKGARTAGRRRRPPLTRVAVACTMRSVCCCHVSSRATPLFWTFIPSMRFSTSRVAGPSNGGPHRRCWYLLSPLQHRGDVTQSHRPVRCVSMLRKCPLLAVPSWVMTPWRLFTPAFCQRSTARYDALPLRRMQLGAAGGGRLRRPTPVPAGC